MLIRSIIQDFLVRNEDTLERIAQEKNNQELTDNDYANTEYQTKGN